VDGKKGRKFLYKKGKAKGKAKLGKKKDTKKGQAFAAS